MVYTKGNTAANFLATLSLISSFIVGYFNNNYLWLLLSAFLVAAAWWTKNYKSTGARATPVEFIVSLVICVVLYGAGRVVGNFTGA